MIEQQIEQDLKAALLGGDQVSVSTLRGLKSALLYTKVDAGKKESGLSEEEVTAVLRKESKKRQESADLFEKGGSADRAKAELAEKAIIEKYLPKSINESELKILVQATISELGAQNMADMGRVMAAVKQKTAGAAEGSLVAGMVKEALAK